MNIIRWRALKGTAIAVVAALLSLITAATVFAGTGPGPWP
jgi:hypothetical protein